MSQQPGPVSHSVIPASVATALAGFRITSSAPSMTAGINAALASMNASLARMNASTWSTLDHVRDTGITNPPRESDTAMTITHNDLQFPDAPFVTGSYNQIGGTPPDVAYRWQRITYGGIEDDLLYMGSCPSCGYATWSSHTGQTMLRNVMDHRYEFGVRLPVDPGEPEGQSITVCDYCHSEMDRDYRARERWTNHTAYARPYHDWPEEITEQITAHYAEREAAIRKWCEVRPIPPTVGALILVNGNNFVHFASFDEKGRVVTDSGNKYDPAKCEVIAAVVHGTPHPEVIGLPSAGRGQVGTRFSVNRYNGNSATLRTVEGGGTATIALNHLGVVMPLLNPATESTEEALERVQWQHQRLMDAMHRRMVAEGTQRGWCSEFDPILDSIGLEPRRGKRRVVMTIEAEVDTAPDPALLQGRGWSSHISTAVMQCTSAEVRDPVSTPMLSA